jgi:hypothetical protein
VAGDEAGGGRDENTACGASGAPGGGGSDGPRTSMPGVAETLRALLALALDGPAIGATTTGAGVSPGSGGALSIRTVDAN